MKGIYRITLAKAQEIISLENDINRLLTLLESARDMIIELTGGAESELVGEIDSILSDFESTPDEKTEEVEILKHVTKTGNV